MKNPHLGTVIRPKARPFGGDIYRLEPEPAEEIQNPVTGTIDGVKVTVERGTTILEAARKIGIYIPHYCYHPKLSIVASCRLCLVEVERVPKLVPSCSTPLGEGQIIHTQSEKARRAREQQMEALLINHPLDCPVCDQAGHCQLQRYSMDHGTQDSRFRFPKRTYPKPDLGPFIDLERNRCILCTRCVRFLEEVAGNPELAVMSRGNDAYIGTFMEQPIKGEFAGNVIDICPVGSLTDKVWRFRSRIWEMQSIPSICPHCAVGCNLNLDRRRRTHDVLRITPRINPRVNDEWICDKGRFGFDFVNNPDRARTPLVKKDGKLSPANASDVFDFIADRWRALRDQHGPEAFAGLISPRQSNETLYLFQRFFRECLGCVNIDHRLEHVALDSDDGYLQSVRLGAANDPIHKVRKASTILLIGSDLPNEAPILNLQIRLRVREGASLLVAHRRGTAYRHLADQHLIYRPGTETQFLAALLYVLAQEKGIEIPGPLSETFAGFDCEAAAEECGVGMEPLRQFARRLLSASGATILLGEETWAANDGVQIVRALANIARLLGLHAGRHIGLNLLVTQSNSRGASDLGVYPHVGPGLVQSDLEGLNTHRILRAASEGKIKSLLIVGEDLLSRYPDRALVEEALDKTEFVVAADTFVHQTAEAADVFLPITPFSETDGTYTNMTGQLQRAQRALDPLPGSMPAWFLMWRLAEQFRVGWGETSPEFVFYRMTDCVPAYKGANWDALIETEWFTRLDAEGSIFASEGGDYVPFEITPLGKGEGLWLQRGPLLFDRKGDATKTPALVERSERCEAVLAPDDLEELGLTPGKAVVVESEGGRVSMPFSVDDGVPEESVVIRGDYDDIGLNRLTSRGAYRVRISQEGAS